MDDASKGPSGAIHLLISWPGGFLAACGCIVSLIASIRTIFATTSRVSVARNEAIVDKRVGTTESGLHISLLQLLPGQYGFQKGNSSRSMVNGATF